MLFMGSYSGPVYKGHLSIMAILLGHLGGHYI